MPEYEEGQEKDPKDTKEFLAACMQRFKLAQEAESEVRKLSLEDLKFSTGDQWPSGIISQRQLDSRPCLVLNRTQQFLRQVTNEQRQQRPAIHINPVGDGATVETADVLQGIIRHIETNSEAEVALDHAFDMMVRTGFGYYRVITDYVDDGSFEQEIFIKRIKNPFTVYFDPHCQEPDYSDARFAFVIEDLPSAVFKKLHPEAAASALSDFSSVGDAAAGWMSKETIRIAEYFYVEEKMQTIYLLEDGSQTANLPEGAVPINEREQLTRRVKWCKITAVDVLEKTEWPGKFIPIIAVLGDDIDIDGKRHLSGMVRHIKDPQRMYNYWNSSATEMIALAPKAPFIGVEGQFEGHEKEWLEANVRNRPYLEYKGTSVSGQPAPPPQRQVYEPPIQAISQMIGQSEADMKGVMGIWDAALGQPGPETSGRAILARQSQSNIANLNYSDNLSRSIRFCGRVVLDLIPKIYDTPRIQRIVNPDSSIRQVIVHNGAGQAEQAQAMMSESIQKIFDIGMGRYDVTISTGPSYQSKRQEAAASMLEFVKAFPQVVPIIGHLVVKSMDWPGAQEISELMKRMLPPELQDQEDTDPRAQLQQLQAKMQALMQQHEVLVKALNEATETIKTKKMELESRERIASMENQTKLLLAQATAQKEGALALLQAQYDAISKRLDLLGQDKPVEAGA